MAKEQDVAGVLGGLSRLAKDLHDAEKRYAEAYERLASSVGAVPSLPRKGGQGQRVRPSTSEMAAATGYSRTSIARWARHPASRKFGTVNGRPKVLGR